MFYLFLLRLCRHRDNIVSSGAFVFLFLQVEKRERERITLKVRQSLHQEQFTGYFFFERQKKKSAYKNGCTYLLRRVASFSHSLSLVRPHFFHDA